MCIFLRDRAYFPSAERLEAEIESRWRASFSILQKNQDWEWILKTLGDALMDLPILDFRKTLILKLIHGYQIKHVSQSI